jgi:hypothetical protein
MGADGEQGNPRIGVSLIHSIRICFGFRISVFEFIPKKAAEIPLVIE